MQATEPVGICLDPDGCLSGMDLSTITAETKKNLARIRNDRYIE